MSWFKTQVFVPFGITHSKDKKHIKIKLLQSSENLCQHYNWIATNKVIAACCLFLEWHQMAQKVMCQKNIVM